MKHIKLLLSVSLLLAIGGAKAQDTISFTLRQVYDFSVGDEFHYDYRTGNDYNLKKRTIERKISISNDSISYDVRDSIFEAVNPSENYVFDREHKHTLYYDNLDSIVTFPNDSVFEYFDERRQVTSFVDSVSSFCEVKGIEHTEIINPLNPEGHLKKTFYIGLGSFETLWYGQGGGYREYLIYFKKGIIECGNPITLGINKAQIKLIELHPNPTLSFIFLENISREYAYAIYTLDGKKVLEGNTVKKIDVRKLESGLYYLEIMANNKILRGKFIKE